MSPTLKYFFIFLTLQLVVISLIAQSPSYRHFTDDDGLPSMTVYGIKQDPYGYLWMTTTKGICRFDGQEFKKYEVPDLKGQDIPYLFMDSEGTPWFYNFAGEIVYIRHDSIFKTTIKSPDPQMSISSFYVYLKVLYITWRLGDKMETIAYDVQNSSNLKILNKPFGINGIHAHRLIGNDLRTRKDRFQLYSILDDTLLFDFPLHSNDNFNYHSEINIISELAPDTLVIITPYFSGLFNSNFQLLQSLKFRDILKDTLLYVSLINPHELFIKTNLNSFIYNLRNNKFQKDVQLGIAINTIFEDQYERKWISTTNKGLFLSMKNNVELFTNTNSGLYSNEIIRLLDDFPTLIITHNNGSISIYNQLNKSWNTIHIPGSRRIKSIIKYKPNEYYVGSDNGLYLLKITSPTKFTFECLKLSSIKDLLITNQNSLTILTSSGTYTCNNDELYNKSYKLTLENALIKTRSNCVTKYKDTTLVGTINGIYYLKDGKYFKWNNIIESELYINKLFNQNDHLLWICTDGNGVYAYQDGNIIDSVNPSKGLPSNSVTSFCPIDDKRIIIGTDNGAFVYDIENHKGFGFNQLDGLPGKEIVDIHCGQGIIWFGTAKGLATIPIDQLQCNPEEPLVSISSAVAFSNGGEIEFKNELPYHSNHLRFKLQTRSLISKDQLKIYYKLNANDSNWILAHSKTLEFVGLAPGKYDLQIKVVNEDGISSDQPVSLSFKINPPWWKTLWFNLLIISSMISGSIGITYWRQNRRRLEEERKRNILDQMNQLRQQALQNQMNPHFIFNALNAIQSFLLVNDEVKAVNYLSKFGKLIRMIFEQSKMKSISLQEEIDLLKNYIHLEELRFGNKVKVTFNIEPELLENAPDILLPPLLIQPIIENSFRHGLFHLEKNGLLLIHIYKIEHKLICSIEDNGVGREESKRINLWKKNMHQSSGIKSTIERLAILDQGRNKFGLEIIDLIDQNGNPSGTKAIVTL